MIVHKLKLQQPFFDDMYFYEKNFEVRKDDRDFKIGDILKLVEYPSEKPKFFLREITYILRGGDFGIKRGYVVLGLKNFGGSYK